jgi:hypothetical protein
MKTQVSVVFLALVLVMAPKLVFADVTSAYDVSLASPGVYFGTGNPNGDFATTTADYGSGNTMTVALRGAIAFGPLIIPTAGNDYACSGAQLCSVQWSVATTGGLNVANCNYLLSIQDLTTGKSVSADPSLSAWGNAKNSSIGFQNSEQLGFSFLQLPLDWQQTDSVAFYLSATPTGALGADPTVEMGFNTAVPEPSEVVLMSSFAGVLGFAVLLRRRFRKA